MDDNIKTNELVSGYNPDNNLNKRSLGYIPIKTQKAVYKVPVDEILYIEKQLRLIFVYTHNNVYRFYGKINGITKYLGDNFFQCHSSFIINFNKITSMENGLFYLEGGMTLRIGQNNYQNAKRYYQKFLNPDRI